MTKRKSSSTTGKGGPGKLKLKKETIRDLRVPKGKAGAVKAGMILGRTPTGDDGSCKCDTRPTIGGSLCCAATWKCPVPLYKLG
jgi:hypothetical protein